MATIYRQQWDMEPIFPGGSCSPDLIKHLELLEQEPKAYRIQIANLPSPETEVARGAWLTLLQDRDRLLMSLHEAGAFIHCLVSQDSQDTQAKLLMGRLQQAVAGLQGVDVLLLDRIRQVSDAAWQQLLADPRFKPRAFKLGEMREDVKELLPPEQETLIIDLSVDGYTAWGRLYRTLVSRISIPVEIDGAVTRLSAGQAYNKFANPSQTFRRNLMERWEEAWSDQAELFAAALNSIGGYRLSTYRHRGWHSPLARSLKDNRVSEATVSAMWTAVQSQKGLLLAYFKRKARLLGVDSLHWYDELAPLTAQQRSISYDQAAAFITEQFAKLSPKMAAFSERAFAQNWIESEDRPGKSPGGFCISLPLSQMSRIFMTFGGTPNGVTTLAHEIGHAYHNEVQWSLPYAVRGATMSTAETASTFAELVVSKAALKASSSKSERLALLDESIRRSVALFMNIHARFLFEQRFYDARKQGLVSVDRLNELMVQSQREAFQDGLSSYHPHFWASKGHFYGTGTPFYNFPYTFGYLFAAGVYARAVQQGPSFEDRYLDLLRDTGRMMTEEIGRRHLDADLTSPQFWESGVSMAMADVQEFLALTEET